MQYNFSYSNVFGAGLSKEQERKMDNRHVFKIGIMLKAPSDRSTMREDVRLINLQPF